MHVVLVTPESRFIKAFRRGQLNNFVQLTMPYLAGFGRPPHTVALWDEYDGPLTSVPAPISSRLPVTRRTRRTSMRWPTIPGWPLPDGAPRDGRDWPGRNKKYPSDGRPDLHQRGRAGGRLVRRGRQLQRRYAGHQLDRRHRHGWSRQPGPAGGL